MSFIKIENNKVVQKQPNAEDGFVEAHDSVLVGQVHDGSQAYEEANFSNPEPEYSWEYVRQLQRKLIVAHRDLIEIHEREVAHNGTDEADYTITPAKYQEFLDYFKLVRDNDEALHSTPADAVTALNGLTIPSL